MALISKMVRITSKTVYQPLPLKWNLLWNFSYKGSSSWETMMTTQLARPHTMKFHAAPCQMPVVSQTAKLDK